MPPKLVPEFRGTLCFALFPFSIALELNFVFQINVSSCVDLPEHRCMIIIGLI